jgi:hypothetical protein
MQAARRDAGGVAVLAEPVREALRVDRAAERIGEDEIPVDIGRSGKVTLEELRCAVRAEHVDRRRVQRDRAAATGRLGRAERRAATGRHQLLLDR